MPHLSIGRTKGAIVNIYSSIERERGVREKEFGPLSGDQSLCVIFAGSDQGYAGAILLVSLINYLHSFRKLRTARCTDSSNDSISKRVLPDLEQVVVESLFRDSDFQSCRLELHLHKLTLVVGETGVEASEVGCTG